MNKQKYHDYINNIGTGKPDKKNCIQEYTDEGEKKVRQLPSKPIREEGEGERKNIKGINGFES